MNAELHDKIENTLKICDMHYQRMIFAWSQVNSNFPVDSHKLENFSPIELALIDQLIYRFSKLQDIMGSRLFKQILDMLGEDVSGIPFIDILNKLEKLGLIDNAETWINLRQTRNSISHEYPFAREEQAEGLNLLIKDIDRLSEIWFRLRTYALSRIS